MVYGPLARETTAEVARGFDPREALLGQTRKSGREPLRSNFRTNDSAESSTIEGPRTPKNHGKSVSALSFDHRPKKKRSDPKKLLALATPSTTPGKIRMAPWRDFVA